MKQTMILTPFLKEEALTVDFDKCDKDMEKIMKYMKTLKNNLDDTRTHEQFLAAIKVTEDEYICAIRSTLKGPKVFHRRRPCEIRINNYNKIALLAWGANMDIQYVMDAYSAMQYTTSYQTKGQRGMCQLLDHVAEQCRDNNAPLLERVRKLGNAFLNCQIICIQEACNHIMGNSAKRASRQDVFVPSGPKAERARLIKEQKQLEKLQPEDTNIFYDNIIEKYQLRPPELRSTHFSEKKDPEKYYYEQVLLFSAFRDEDSELCGVPAKELFEKRKEEIERNRSRPIEGYKRMTDEAFEKAENGGGDDDFYIHVPHNMDSDDDEEVNELRRKRSSAGQRGGGAEALRYRHGHAARA